jgi:adenosylcobinamide-GDP ribazoletransferase
VATPADHGRAVPWYPAVGAILGAILAATAFILNGLPPALTAVLLVALWTGLTGAIHLDGLADSADGYMGGHGDRERILAIMRDRSPGVGAVVAVVLVLLGKAVASACVVADQAWGALLAAPILGRAALVAVMTITPYARGEGLASGPSQHVDRAAAAGSVLLALLAGMLLTGGDGLMLAVVLILFALLLRAFFKRTLGGFTGDTLGATCEVTEVVVLTVVAWGGSCL